MANFTGNSQNNSFAGTSENDVADGNGGSDTLSGAGGQDTLAGNGGADTLNGGTGEDWLFSGDQSPPFNLPYYDNEFTPPLLDTGIEVDTLRGGDDTDRLFAGYGDNVDGGADGYGGDYLYISFLGATAGVTADFRLATQVIGGGTITGIENVSWVEGSNFDDDINVATNSSSGYSDFTSVWGMGGNDRLVASYYTGTLFGGDGDDVVDGRGSQYLQRVVGDDGDDTLFTNSNTFAEAYGGDGNDTIYSHGRTYGGAGSDRIILMDSYYTGTVYGEAGNDRIHASAVGNVISGGDGADSIYGGQSRDEIDGGSESDRLYGGSGNDSVAGGAGNDLLDGGAGDDELRGNDGKDRMISGAGVDDMAGGAADDILYFGGDYGPSDTASGGEGANDKLILQGDYPGLSLTGARIGGIEIVELLGSAITTFGGQGSTPFDYNLTTADSLVAAGGLLTVRGKLADDETLTFDGSAESNGSFFVTGGAGADNLSGGAGNDVLQGKSGSDVLAGGGGDDIYEVTDAGDQVVEAASAGTDEIRTDLEAFSLAGLAVENLTGIGSGDQLLVGSGVANLIDGGAGADRMEGRRGNDIYIVDDADDVVVELAGGGVDEIRTALESFSLEGTQVEHLSGLGDGAQTLAGNGLANTLDGGGGADRMRGGAGNDTYVVDDSGDSAEETSAGHGIDTVRSSASFTLGAFVEDLVLTGDGAVDGVGNGGANTITGNASANLLNGKSGADTLKGAAGDDTLAGGKGVDTLKGGGGADGFLFNTSLDAAQNVDQVLDFASGTDRMVLEDAIFASLGAGALAPEALAIGTAAADADDRILYDPTTGSLSYDPDGTGTAAAIQFAMLETKPATLAATDFLVI